MGLINMDPLHLHIEGTDLPWAGNSPVAVCLLAQDHEIGFLSTEDLAVGRGSRAERFHKNVVEVPGNIGGSPQNSIGVIAVQVCARRHGRPIQAIVIGDIGAIVVHVQGAVKRGGSLALPLRHVDFAVSDAIGCRVRIDFRCRNQPDRRRAAGGRVELHADFKIAIGPAMGVYAVRRSGTDVGIVGLRAGPLQVDICARRIGNLARVKFPPKAWVVPIAVRDVSRTHIESRKRVLPDQLVPGCRGRHDRYVGSCGLPRIGRTGCCNDDGGGGRHGCGSIVEPT